MTDPGAPGDLRLWGQHILLASINGLALLAVYTMPVLLGGIAEAYALSAGVLGLIASMNFTGMAVGALISTAVSGRLSIRQWLVLGMLLITAGELTSANVDTAAWLSFTRFTSGCGAGLVTATVAIAVSELRHAERGYSALQFAAAVVGGMGISVFGPLISSWGLQGVFYLITGISLLTLAAIAFVQGGESGEVAEETAAITDYRGMTIVILLIAFGLFQIAGGVIWAFAELVGDDWQLAADPVNTALVLATVATLLGALSSASAQNRFGQMSVVMVGLGGAGLFLIAGSAITPTQFLFVTMMCGFSFTYAITVPALQVLIAAAGSLRIISISILLFWVGYALGPAIGGDAISRTGTYNAAIWTTLAVTVLCLILMLAVQAGRREHVTTAG